MVRRASDAFNRISESIGRRLSRPAGSRGHVFGHFRAIGPGGIGKWLAGYLIIAVAAATPTKIAVNARKKSMRPKVP